MFPLRTGECVSECQKGYQPHLAVWGNIFRLNVVVEILKLLIKSKNEFSWLAVKLRSVLRLIRRVSPKETLNNA